MTDPVFILFREWDWESSVPFGLAFASQLLPGRPLRFTHTLTLHLYQLARLLEEESLSALPLLAS